MSSKLVLNAKKKATSAGVPRRHDVVALTLFVGGIEVLGDEQLVGEVVPPLAVETSADDVATSAVNQRAQERACSINVPFNAVVPQQARELRANERCVAQRGRRDEPAGIELAPCASSNQLHVGALAGLSDGSRAAFGQGHKHAQGFEHAFLATEMPPKIFVQEHRLLEVAAQRCELVRADCRGASAFLRIAGVRPANRVTSAKVLIITMLSSRCADE
jgi:hypothetical protein